MKGGIRASGSGAERGGRMGRRRSLKLVPHTHIHYTRVRGFSFVGLMWGAGAIFGPSTGGLLTNPGERILRSFDHFRASSLISIFRISDKYKYKATTEPRKNGPTRTSS